jgi:hypothetical protein
MLLLSIIAFEDRMAFSTFAVRAYLKNLLPIDEESFATLAKKTWNRNVVSVVKFSKCSIVLLNSNRLMDESTCNSPKWRLP